MKRYLAICFVLLVSFVSLGAKQYSVPLMGAHIPSFYYYGIDYSCRFNSADSAHLTKTPAGVGTSQKIWTFSSWVKRSDVTAAAALFSSHSVTNYDLFGFESDGTLRVYLASDGTDYVSTSTVFRDPSAWYHVLLAVDTTQATQESRVRAYVNNVEQILTGTFVAQNIDCNTSGATVHAIGKFSNADNRHFQGAMADVYFIDGSQLTPSSFGESKAGVFVPKSYTGTYGTNGFKLDFASAADLGNDVSGNGNDYTSSDLEATDQILDTPTNNFCAWNPLHLWATGGSVSEAGSLHQTGVANYRIMFGTFGASSGTWYFEMRPETGVTNAIVGISCNTQQNSTTYSLGYEADQYAYLPSGDKKNSNVSSSYGDTYSITDVIGIALDLDNGKIWFAKNGVWQAGGNPVSGVSPAFSGLSGTFFPAYQFNSVTEYATCRINCGQDGYGIVSAYADDNGYGAFKYDPPAGFLALCTANLPDPDWVANIENDVPGNYIDVVTRTGTGAAATISSLAFQPDLVVAKARNAAIQWAATDSTRGATKEINFDTDGVETTVAEGLTAFLSTGYSLGTDASYNQAATTYVDLAIKKFAGFFDIVAYLGTGANRTISHSLGVAPNMIVTVNLDTDVRYKSVYHSGMATDAETDYLRLHTADQLSDNATWWNDTAPTLTAFSVGTAVHVNENSIDYIAYLFSNKEGLCHTGYYTGTGNADGPFAWCGFKPKWVMIKAASCTGHWVVLDAERDANNVVDRTLGMDNALAETTEASVDFLANGFKVRGTHYTINSLPYRYVFIAFAEDIFKIANAN